MDNPTMFEAQPLTPDTDVLGAYLPVPGLGVLPVNAFVIRAKQPVLIDTGLASLRDDFMQRLRSSVDPADLRWIWITHNDADHLGNLEAVLAEAPHARLVTTFLGMGKLGLQQLPTDRVYLLNPGQTLDLGDRRLQAVVPPTFDAPETTAVFDTRNRTLFSADCFGAILPAPAHTVAELEADTLRDGMVTWTTVDAPWLSLVHKNRFRRSCSAVSDLAPRTIASSHLPPARDVTTVLLGHLDAARRAPAFVGPDQAALEAMLVAMSDVDEPRAEQGRII